VLAGKKANIKLDFFNKKVAVPVEGGKRNSQLMRKINHWESRTEK